MTSEKLDKGTEIYRYLKSLKKCSGKIINISIEKPIERGEVFYRGREGNSSFKLSEGAFEAIKMLVEADLQQQIKEYEKKFEEL